MTYQPSSAYISSCNCVDKCANNHCMFRLRDIYNHPVWWVPGQEEYTRQVLIEAGVDSEEDMKKIGWPTMKGRPGTNCVSFYCDWYIGPEE